MKETLNKIIFEQKNEYFYIHLHSGYIDPKNISYTITKNLQLLTYLIYNKYYLLRIYIYIYNTKKSRWKQAIAATHAGC